jgi:hypothetical protein
VKAHGLHDEQHDGCDGSEGGGSSSSWPQLEEDELEDDDEDDEQDDDELGDDEGSQGGAPSSGSASHSASSLLMAMTPALFAEPTVLRMDRRTPTRSDALAVSCTLAVHATKLIGSSVPRAPRSGARKAALMPSTTTTYPSGCSASA